LPHVLTPPSTITACLGLDELGEEREAARLLDKHPILLGLAEGPEGVGPASRHLRRAEGRGFVGTKVDLF
jgi:hypothetical protein